MFTSDLIRYALEEDLGGGDITTLALVPADLRSRGCFVAKEKIVVAGLGVAGGVFSAIEPSVKLAQTVTDGQEVSAGTELLVVEGSTRALLAGERVALNFLQRLSGIATLTRKFVERTAGTKTRILDTRKTVPLFRHLDKYAVRMGGGVNHRLGLYDGYLVKDNHIAALHGAIAEAVGRIRKRDPKAEIVVEVTSPDEAEEAKRAGASRLLLDNMDDEMIVETLRRVSPIPTEVSGGVLLDRVAALAGLGVDFISVGALTHSPGASDISMELERL